ncbi:hypothetical protein [Marinobacter sp. JSM 1782161]|uniref:hypothetical protein n=1 Tax=Marinobacter sp. JSM 1782161 TaxID=2685906 RepID=UPI0014021DD5|nr:hypothetical protein [Marinobacter sp. JSM 1782161]
MPLDTMIFPESYQTPEIELKRALLTYNKVFLIDPKENDIMPPELMTQAMMPPGMPFSPFAINMGAPVCPIIKSQSYENDFDRLLETFQPALKAGCLEVTTTYKESIKPGTVAIGAFSHGGATGYPLNPQAVLWFLRQLGGNQSLLKEALGAQPIDPAIIERASDIRFGAASGQINGAPALPMLDVPQQLEQHQAALTKLALSRIASVIKYYGYCENKNIVPFLYDPQTMHFVSRIISCANSSMDQATSTDQDAPWARVQRLQQILFSETLDGKKLEEASISDILRARTPGWLKSEEKKDGLLERLHEMAREEENFEEQASSELSGYLKQAEDLAHDRNNFRLQLYADIIPQAMDLRASIPFATGAGAATIGVSTAFTGASVPLIFIGAAAWACNMVREYGPQMRDLRRREQSLRSSSGLSFYRRVKGFR